MKLKITKIFLMSFLVLLGNSLFGQKRIISGKVTDESGSVLPGVTVLAKGTNIGTTTNSYSIYLPHKSILDSLLRILISSNPTIAKICHMTF